MPGRLLFTDEPHQTSAYASVPPRGRGMSASGWRYVVNELNKLLLSLLLVAAGFFAASCFGPPDLTNRVFGVWDGSGLDPAQSLRPLPPSTLRSNAPEPPAQQVAPGPSQRPVTAQAHVAPEPPSDSFAWDDATTSNAAPADRPFRLTAANEEDAWGRPAFETPAWGAQPPAASEPSPGFATSDPAPLAAPPLAAAAPSGPTFGSWEARRPLSATPDTPAPVRPVEIPSGPSQVIEHVVTDGDTLPLLAKRYLYDERRGQELFELNRDRLESPDLLPIGVMLRVPIESHKPASQPTARADPWGGDRSVGDFRTVSESRGAPGATAARPSTLVPIGRAIEREPAPPPDRLRAADWSW